MVPHNMTRRRVRSIAAGVLLAGAAVVAAEGLLRNGSFEKADVKGMPVGWQGEIRAGAEGRFELVPEARDGALALHMVHANEAKEWVRASQEPIPVRPGARLRISGWLKAQGPWQVLLYEFVAAGTYTSKSLASGKATDWQRLNQLVTLSPNAHHLKLSLIVPTQGEAWFDGFTIADLDQPPRLRIPPLQATPTLDGDVRDAAWQGAAVVDGLLALGGRRARRRTRASGSGWPAVRSGWRGSAPSRAWPSRR